MNHNPRSLHIAYVLCLCLGIVTAPKMASTETVEPDTSGWRSYVTTQPKLTVEPLEQQLCTYSYSEYKKTEAAYQEHFKKCEVFTDALFKAIKQGQLNATEATDYGMKKGQCLQFGFYEKSSFNYLDYTQSFHAITLFQQISNKLNGYIEKLNTDRKNTCVSCNNKWPEQSSISISNPCDTYSTMLP